MAFASFPITTLTDTLGLKEHHYVFLIGGGGKTTLMFALARHLLREGHTVVTATSTRILRPPPDASCEVVIHDSLQELAPSLRDQSTGSPHVTIGKALLADNKLSGFSADELDCLRRAKVADYLLVEADGAAGRSLKAHDEHEPVVSRHADLVIAVIGIDCIGKPLDDEHVHRAPLARELLNRPESARVTVDDVAAVFFHPRGYLQKMRAETEVAVFVSKASSEPDKESAKQLARALRTADADRRIGRIVIGELVGASPFVQLLGAPGRTPTT